MEQVFAPLYVSQRYFGDFVPWVFDDLPLSRATDGNLLGAYRIAASADVPATPTWRYWPGTAQHISYGKTALWLQTLERMLGWDTLQKVLSTFFTRYAYKHPKPQDFFDVASQVSGQDLTWFFDQVHRSAATFDYSVDVFTSEPREDRGVQADSTRPITPSTAGSPYRTAVVVRRQGDGIFPVDVRVVLENRQEVRWRWDGRDRWKLFEADTPVRAISAEVDPDRILLLDPNYTNNSRTLAPRARAAARKWSLTWLIWLQDHLLTYGFFI